MNKKIIMTLSFAAAFFVACGDDSSTQAPANTEQVGTEVVDPNGMTTPDIGENVDVVDPNGAATPDVGENVDVVDPNGAITPGVGESEGGTNTFENVLVDERDGQTYKITKIGSQVWMAENLNYDYGDGSYCYGNNPAKCNQYGHLYTWDAAMNACPGGWRLPSNDEMETLLETVKLKVEQIVTQKKLNAEPLKIGEDKWYNHLMGLFDSIGFSAQFAGMYDGIFKEYKDTYGGYWSSTESDSYKAYMLSIHYTDSDAKIVNYGTKGDAFSVRCLKD